VVFHSVQWKNFQEEEAPSLKELSKRSRQTTGSQNIQIHKFEQF